MTRAELRNTGKEDIHNLANRLSKEANETSFSKTAEKSRDEHMAAASAMRKAAKDAPELKRFYETRAAEHEKKAAGYLPSRRSNGDRALRLSWFDLGRADDTAQARAATRGKAGVYLLRRKGETKIHYIGSSEPGAIQRRKAPAALRMWKTINRHFQSCRTRGVYAFGSDNWCTSSSERERYELALVLTPVSDARRVEASLIAQHHPTANAWIEKERSGGARAREDESAGDGIPF